MIANWVIQAVAAVVACLLAMVGLRSGRNRRLKTELKNRERATRRAEGAARNLVKVQEQQQKIRRQADAEQQSIDEADDATLIDRANDLFA